MEFILLIMGAGAAGVLMSQFSEESEKEPSAREHDQTITGTDAEDVLSVNIYEREHYDEQSGEFETTGPKLVSTLLENIDPNHDSVNVVAIDENVGCPTYTDVFTGYLGDCHTVLNQSAEISLQENGDDLELWLTEQQAIEWLDPGTYHVVTLKDVSLNEAEAMIANERLTFGNMTYDPDDVIDYRIMTDGEEIDLGAGDDYAISEFAGVVHLGDGNDSAYGGHEDLIVYGGAGDDFFFDHTGEVYGGSGDDDLRFYSGGGFGDAGDGDDVIMLRPDYAWNWDGNGFDLDASYESVVIRLGSGEDTLRIEPNTGPFSNQIEDTPFFVVEDFDPSEDQLSTPFDPGVYSVQETDEGVIVYHDSHGTNIPLLVLNGVAADDLNLGLPVK